MSKALNYIFSFRAILLFAIGLGIFTSCSNETDLLLNENISLKKGSRQSSSIYYSTSTTAPSIAPCGTPTEVVLYAGQTIDAGTVTVENTADKVYVTVTSGNGFYLSAVDLYIGSTIATGSNPAPGQFPYHSGNLSNETTVFSFEFDKDDLPATFYIAVHANVYQIVDNTVVNSNSAWGDGTRFTTKGNWATYFTYEIQNDCCLLSTETFTIYGGQTIDAGTLLVTNDETNLYVTYTSNDNWYFGALHLYVGDLNDLPVNNAGNPVNGSFPYTTDLQSAGQSYTFTIPLSSLSGCYIIAAHSELVKIENGVVTQTETGWSYGTAFPSATRWGWYSSYCTQTCE